MKSLAEIVQVRPRPDLNYSAVLFFVTTSVVATEKIRIRKSGINQDETK